MDDFSIYCEELISEILNKKTKREVYGHKPKSRYWDIDLYPSASQPRKVQNISIKTPSQKSKLGYQQYMGSPLGTKGIRVRNKSEKTPAQIGIAKGHGNHLRINGTNAKTPGSVINSKQDNMEIKYKLGNDMYKIGPKNKTNYTLTSRPNAKEHMRKFDN
jgi:hypothetical protein